MVWHLIRYFFVGCRKILILGIFGNCRLLLSIYEKVQWKRSPCTDATWVSHESSSTAAVSKNFDLTVNCHGTLSQSFCSLPCCGHAKDKFTH